MGAVSGSTGSSFWQRKNVRTDAQHVAWAKDFVQTYCESVHYLWNDSVLFNIRGEIDCIAVSYPERLRAKVLRMLGRQSKPGIWTIKTVPTRKRKNKAKL